MSKTNKTIEFTDAERVLTQHAVNDYIKVITALVKKVEKQGMADAAKKIGQSVELLKDIETKLL